MHERNPNPPESPIPTCPNCGEEMGGEYEKCPACTIGLAWYEGRAIEWNPEGLVVKYQCHTCKKRVFESTWFKDGAGRVYCDTSCKDKLKTARR